MRVEQVPRADLRGLAAPLARAHCVAVAVAVREARVALPGEIGAADPDAVGVALTHELVACVAQALSVGRARELPGHAALLVVGRVVVVVHVHLREVPLRPQCCGVAAEQPVAHEPECCRPSRWGGAATSGVSKGSSRMLAPCWCMAATAPARARWVCFRAGVPAALQEVQVELNL